MRKFILSLVAMLSILVASTQHTINDPNAEVREVKSFHGISISNAFDVYLTQGNDEAVAVSASDEKYRNMITVEVNNGILTIGVRRDSWKWFKGNKKLKAYISFKKVNKIDINGASDVYVQGTISTKDELKIGISGASNFRGRIDANKVVVDLSGASDMKVSGRTDQLNVDASGASKFKGSEFETEFCNARATGASDISITVNKELSANASGASDVKYKGNGVIRDIKTSGASKISKI